MRVRRERRRCPIAVLAAGTTLVSMAGIASAEVRTWNGGDGTQWYTPTEWSPAGAPAPSDALVVNAGRPVTDSLTAIRVSAGGSITLSGPAAALGQKRNPSSWLAPQLSVGYDGRGSVLV